MDTAAVRATRPYSSLLGFVVRRSPDLTAFIFALLVSRQTAGFPFYGGIWLLTGQIALLCTEPFHGMQKRLFSRKSRLIYAVCVLVSSLICIGSTLLFLKNLTKQQFYLLLLFIINQLAGLSLANEPALIPALGRRKPAWSLAVFALISAAALSVAGLVIRAEIPFLMILYDALFLLLLGARAAIRPKKAWQPAAIDAFEPVDRMEDVYAFRQYRRMASNTLTSIEVSLTLLISYMIAIPSGADLFTLLDAARLLAILGIGIWALRTLLNRSRMKAIGSNIAFLLFSLLWIFIILYAYNHPSVLQGSNLVLPIAIISLCMAALSMALLNMDRYMAVIGQIGVQGSGPDRFEIFRNVSLLGGSVASRFVLMLVMAAAAAFFGVTTQTDFIAVAILVRNKLVVIPLAFLVLAALSALQQPLTKYYEEKIGRYMAQKSSGKVSRALEQKLFLSLVRKSSKRFGIKLLRAAVKPFVILKRIGVEHVDPRRFPCVFVCNHAEVFGPIAATVNIPFFNRPWIIQEMVDREKIAAHLQTGFDHWAWVPSRIRSRLGRLMGPFLLWVMQSMDPIPVYRSSIKDITKTIALSTEALEAEDNILIFPENPFATGDRYVTAGIGEFFEGFVHIAKNYCRSTGKPLVFYGVYADSQARTISFSEGIEFNAAAPFNEERDRICKTLRDEMTRMSVQRK